MKLTRLTPTASFELAGATAPPSPGVGQPVELKKGRVYRLSCDARISVRVVGGQPASTDLVVTPEAPLVFVADVTAMIVAARTSAITRCWLQEEL